MAFLKKWYISILPISILIAFRLFAYFKVGGIVKLLDGLIQNKQDLELVKYSLGLCAFSSLLTVLMFVLVIILIIILFRDKDTPFIVLLGHFVLFITLAVLSFGINSPCENSLSNMRVYTSDLDIEAKYKSYLEQFDDGIFFIN